MRAVLQVSAMMKKHLVEGVVPVLIELKRTLEGMRHWLLGDLLNCIRALLKEHKSEVRQECSVTQAGQIACAWDKMQNGHA